MRVLDIGCGTGGSAFYMARNFGAEVLGIDLSDNMLAIANEHKFEMSNEIQNLVTFRFLDATHAIFPAESFDVVYSRDAIMHIADKAPLYEKVLVIYFSNLKIVKLSQFSPGFLIPDIDFGVVIIIVFPN